MSDKRNPPDNSDEYKFFLLFCKLVDSRRSINGERTPREYCSAATINTIYNHILRKYPEFLVIDDKKMSYEEYKGFIEKHLATVKENILDGYPVILEGGIGTIGVNVYQKKVQTNGSRLKKDKDKVYINMPHVEIKVTKEHLIGKISPLINLNLLGVRLRNGIKHIVSEWYKDKNKYSLTGDNMHKYAKKLNYRNDK